MNKFYTALLYALQVVILPLLGFLALCSYWSGEPIF